MTRLSVLLGLLISAQILAPRAQSAERPAGGRVNNLKIVSDKIDDVTTLENILKSFVKPGMTDQERSRGLWTAAIKYRHQTAPPNEFLAADWEAHDPVKLFNVYGYCMCCCASSLIAALNRADGREARGRILNGHSVPEVRSGDAWHMYDASLITYFPRSTNGVDASVDEISAAVKGWYETHAGYRGNASQLLDLMRRDGWTGWKAAGPELLAHCPFYRLGYLPARTHGWDATMVEYDRNSEVYEYGYQIGHRALFSLRPGESFVREAGNRGLHVNRESDPKFDALTARVPLNDLAYVPQFLPGYRGGVIGNGVHRYAPALARGELEQGAEVYENLASGGTPALHPRSPGTAVAVVPFLSPYVYLGGKLTLKAYRRSSTDRVIVSLSANNGRTFTPIWSADSIGRSEGMVDLSDKILRRYAYWLKLELAAAQPDGAGLESLVVENDFQHAPRTLPWLGKGRNMISVATDDDPGIATRSISCRITADPAFSKNETHRTMGVTPDNLELKYESFWWKGGTGTLTVPIEIPGDLKVLRFSAQVRARGEKDLVRMLVSADDGRTWREAARMAGPTAGRTEAFRFADWPPGTRKALLRFELTGNNTVGVLSFRVDADYRDPLAASTLRPFRVVHRWREGDRTRSFSHTVDRLPLTYAIETDAEPEMISVSYEMSEAR